MHKNQQELMEYFVNYYVRPIVGRRLDVVDVGSLDVNGNDRYLFPESIYSYTGCDIVAGANVDVVFDGPNDWQDIGQFDVVITSNTMEHVTDTHKFIRNLASLAKPGGLVCVVVPFACGEHKYPVDCWRILPDGMRFLFESIAKLSVIECHMRMSPYDESVGDTIGIARKTEI